MKKVSEI